MQVLGRILRCRARALHSLAPLSRTHTRPRKSPHVPADTGQSSGCAWMLRETLEPGRLDNFLTIRAPRKRGGGFGGGGGGFRGGGGGFAGGGMRGGFGGG